MAKGKTIKEVKKPTATKAPKAPTPPKAPPVVESISIDKNEAFAILQICKIALASDQALNITANVVHLQGKFMPLVNQG